MLINGYEYDENDLVGEYYMMFDDCWPIYELGYNESKIIECLRQGKTAKELGYLPELDNEKKF